MSEANFTKSNWTLHLVNHDMTVKGELHVVASDGYPSAFVPSWNDDNETALEAMANAHLIAAAPEMYYEIESDIFRLEQRMKFKDENREIMPILEAERDRKVKLLAKARGES